MCGIIATLIVHKTTSLTYSQKPKYDHGTTLDGRLGEGVGVVRVERHLLVLCYMYFVRWRFCAPPLRQDVLSALICLKFIFFLASQGSTKQAERHLSLQFACRQLESYVERCTLFADGLRLRHVIFFAQ